MTQGGEIIRVQIFPTTVWMCLKDIQINRCFQIIVYICA